MNPYDTGEPINYTQREVLAIEEATVVSPASSMDSLVDVQPVTHDQTIEAEIGVAEHGDGSLPEREETVIIAYRVSDKPVIVQRFYEGDSESPTLDIGERILGHASTDSQIYFQSDGSIRLENDTGATVTLQADGTVSINGGTNSPVTDVTTTTDADGHVTDVSVTRSTDILLP
jgi:hypothetical protein